MKSVGVFSRAVVLLMRRLCRAARRFFNIHYPIFAVAGMLCVMPIVMERVPQAVCWLSIPERLGIRVHESQVDNVHRQIPLQVRDVIDGLFAEGVAPSKHARVTFYMFMHYVYELLKHGKRSPVLYKAFSTAELRELRAISRAYGTTFDDVCTDKKFVKLIFTERSARYIADKLMQEVRAEIGDTRIVQARPWLCILRNIKLVLSLKYQNPEAAEFAIRALQDKGSWLVREDMMYELESGENWAGKPLTPARRESLQIKVKKRGFARLQTLDRQSIVLLQHISSVFNLASQ